MIDRLIKLEIDGVIEKIGLFKRNCLKEEQCLIKNRSCSMEKERIYWQEMFDIKLGKII